MTILPNILTDKEKASLLRVYHHDMANSAMIVSTWMYCSNTRGMRITPEAIAHMDFLVRSLECASALTTTDDFSKKLELTSLERIMSNTNEIARMHFPRTQPTKHPNANKKLFVPGVIACMGMFIKNSRRHAYEAEDVLDGEDLLLSAEEVVGFPSDAVYIPDHAREHNEFTAFRVHDIGAGFGRGKIPKKYFTTCPPVGQHGFGLYFAGLVGKVLQAPIGISSKRGDTTVSFYHPTDYKNE